MKIAKTDTTAYCRSQLEIALSADKSRLAIEDLKAISGALGCFQALINAYEEIYAVAYPYSSKIEEVDA